MFQLGIFGIAFYVLGILTVFAYAIVNAPYLIGNESFRKKFKFLIFRFRPECWFWGLVTLFRAFALSVARIIEKDDGMLQIAIMAVVVIVHTFLILWFMPWRDNYNNWLDITINMVLMYVLFASLRYAYGAESSYQQCALIIVYTVCIVTFIVFLVCLKSGYDATRWGKDRLAIRRDRLSWCLFHGVAILSEYDAADWHHAVSKFDGYDLKISADFLEYMATEVKYSLLDCLIEREIPIQKRVLFYNPIEKKRQYGAETKRKFVYERGFSFDDERSHLDDETGDDKSRRSSHALADDEIDHIRSSVSGVFPRLSIHRNFSGFEADDSDEDEDEDEEDDDEDEGEFEEESLDTSEEGDDDEDEGGFEEESVDDMSDEGESSETVSDDGDLKKKKTMGGRSYDNLLGGESSDEDAKRKMKKMRLPHTPQGKH